jgi:uncharacterized protein YndB with AHSA1/START domain
MAMETPTINMTEITVMPGTPELEISREFDAPRDLVFRAFIDPDLYAQWIGPRRLTTVVERSEPIKGGSWRFVQTDPEGKKYAFHGVFHEVSSPERYIRTFEFEGLPEKGHVSLETVTFAALPGNRTKVVIKSVFQSVTDRDGMIEGGMEKGVNEGFERLDELLEKTKSAGETGLVITRLIDAPREDVFKALTEPESVKKWWGPEGLTSPVVTIDLRKGGKYLFSVEDPAGNRYWNGGVYREIHAPDRLVFLNYLADERGNKLDPAACGMNKNLPKESVITVTFDEEKGKTRLSITYEPPTSEAVREAMNKSGMIEGWNSSLNKLQRLLER